MPWTPRLRWQAHASREDAVLDFVRQLLEGHLIAPESEAAPGSEEGDITAGLYRDTFAQLGELCVHGCLRYLVHAGGWAKMPFAEGERVRTGRIWTARTFQRLTPELGADVLSLAVELCRIFALRRGDASLGDDSTLAIMLLGLGDESRPWEHLLLHLWSRPLALLGQGSSVVPMLAGASSFNALTLGADVRLAPEPPIELERAVDALHAWGWAMPWLSEDVAWWWWRADAARFGSDLDHFVATVERLDALLRIVIDAAIAEERHEWLLVPLDFFLRAYGASAHDSPEEASEPLEWLVEDRSLRERQQERDRWGQMLRHMARLGEQRDRIHRAHPVDREPGERVFLSVWEALDAASVRDRVEALRSHLERVMG